MVSSNGLLTLKSQVCTRWELESMTIGFDRTWEDQITLYTQQEPRFELLPRASELPDRELVSVNIDSMQFAHSLEWYLEKDAAPLPVTDDREGYYGLRHYEYWLSGLQTLQYTLDIMKQHRISPGVFVDLGSASGRVARHAAAYGAFQQVWALDINWRHINWMQRYLPNNIKAVNISSVPHIPLADNSVDCLSAMSVFTHIEAMETAWLAEIHRVLRPGGISILSVVTEHQMAVMDETWPMYKPIVEHPRWNENFITELQYQGKIVLRWRADASYTSNVVYHTDYLHKVWGSFFEIVEHRRQFPDYQDWIIVRRRS